MEYEAFSNQYIITPINLLNVLTSEIYQNTILQIKSLSKKVNNKNLLMSKYLITMDPSNHD